MAEHTFVMPPPLPVVDVDAMLAGDTAKGLDTDEYGVHTDRCDGYGDECACYDAGMEAVTEDPGEFDLVRVEDSHDPDWCDGDCICAERAKEYCRDTMLEEINSIHMRRAVQRAMENGYRSADDIIDRISDEL